MFFFLFNTDVNYSLLPRIYVYVGLQLIKGEFAGKIRNKRVVELGAGTGLAGLCAAAQGAHVLVTDVPSIVSTVIYDSIALNSTELTTPNGIIPNITWCFGHSEKQEK